MEKKDFIWKMGGQQGQGVESCGEILGRVLAQEGYSLFSQRLFASRIKGGHTTIALRIATKEIATIGEHVDCLVALDQETIDLHGKEICEGGVIIADDAFKPKWETHTGRIFLPLPITEMAKKYGLDMIVYTNQEGVKQGINPFDHGSAYTDIMKTQALKQALDKYEFTAAFGGGRRDEEKSRAKERIFSFRNSAHAWDPKNQRPEMWKLYNTKLFKGEEVRVFPLSNWTEKDIWQYIRQENIEIPSLYFAKERPVVYRDGNIIMVDDDRMRLKEGEKPVMKKVRFRTLGCYPLTGGVESDAETLDEIIEETLSAVSSERTSRVIDNEAAGSMERRKREGYF